MFECPICIVPLDDEGNNLGAAFLEFRSPSNTKLCLIGSCGSFLNKSGLDQKFKN